jgi:hypothetical protein
MGWLPIVLAVCGFLFFVAIVNYNSINTHKEAIMLAFFNLCQTARARNTLLKSLSGYDFRQESDLAQKSELLMEDFNLLRFPEYLRYIRQEKQSMDDSQLYLRANRPATKETRKLLKSLQVLNHRQHIHIKVFNRKVREYNQLISTYPTKMVARTTGFKNLGA